MPIQWTLFIAIIIVILQSWVYKRWGLRKIEYSRFFSVPAVFEGEEVEMVERIFNGKLLPIPWLRVESRIDAALRFGHRADLDVKHDEFHKSLFSLKPYMLISRRHRVKCTRRGCYDLETCALTSGDIFGLIERSVSVSAASRLLVYPRLLPLEEIPLPSHSWLGDVTVRRWIMEDPFLIAGVREYRSGDPLNRINWNATARAGKIQVHNREFSSDPRLMIYLNVETEDDLWDTVWDTEPVEKGISYAASLAQLAVDRGIPVGFGCNGQIKGEPDRPVRIPPQCSNEHLIGLFECMAKLVIKRTLTFYTFLEQEIERGLNNTDILIITPFFSERIQNQIDRLQALDNAVEVIRVHRSPWEGGIV